MTPAAAKGEKLFLLAAALLAAAAALLAPAWADASRYLPQALEPVTAPQASLEDLAAGDADQPPALPALTNADRLDLVDLAAGARLEEQRLGLHLASGEPGAAWKTASGGQTWALEDNGKPISEMGAKTHRLIFQGLWTDPVTGLAYARARWYDARNASWLSEDPLLDVDSPNLYAFVGWGPYVATDPLGRQVAGDPEAVEILKRIQAAADEAARRHGVANWNRLLVGGPKGDLIHAELQRLLMDEAGPYYHPRIVTEVDVSPGGVVHHFGQRTSRHSGHLVKDMVVLNPGMTAKDINPLFTRAKDVTQFVVDLKIGKRGAELKQAETLGRFGVNNVVLRPFGDIFQSVEASKRNLNRLQKRLSLARALPNVARCLVFLGVAMTAAEANAAFEAGDLDRAMKVMTGVDLVEDAAVALGNRADEEAKRYLDAAGASRGAKAAQLEQWQAVAEEEVDHDSGRPDTE